MKSSLARLGYSPGGINNTWNANVAGAYDNYWADRLLDNSIISKSAATPPDSYYMSRIIDEYNSHAFTNDQGIVEVKIPKKFLDNRKVYIDIGFWEFPITLESLNSDDRDDLISRSHNNEQPTNFFVMCTLGSDHGDKQVTDWNKSINGEGDFGWCVLKDDKASMLQSALRLKLKTDEDEFTKLDADLLSKYYEESNEHFVLFGMEWCQPVWDEFEDAKIGAAGSITYDTYIQDPDFKHLHMHLVTMFNDMDGSDIYGGKGYGKKEGSGNTRWRGNGHPGIDLHAREGDLLFAFHSGKVTNYTTSIGGRTAKLDIPDIRVVEYLHMNDFVNALNNKRCMSGQIIGYAGRTGNLTDIYPGHVHMNVGGQGETVGLRTQVNRKNQIAIPFNDTPLLFPCSCEITSKNASPNKRKCKFTILEFICQCWAAAELKCPYIVPDSKSNVKLQLQLRYIKEKSDTVLEGFTRNKNNNPEYYHPAIPIKPYEIDGLIGNAPSNVNTVGLTNGTVVEKLSGAKHGGKLVKIRFTQSYGQVKEGWIESSLIDGNSRLSIPHWEYVNSLSNLIKDHVGFTRMAIYFLRKANSLLDYADYASNFSMDDAAWVTLNSIAPVTIPEGI